MTTAVEVSYALVQMPAGEGDQQWALVELVWPMAAPGDNIAFGGEEESVTHRACFGLALCLLIDPSEVQEMQLGVEKLNELAASERASPAPWSPDNGERFVLYEGDVRDRFRDEPVWQWRFQRYEPSKAFAVLANRACALAARPK